MAALLSIIIPAYNEEESINKVIETLGIVLSSVSFSYEIIFVDDGSKDSTWKQIMMLAKSNKNIAGIKFSRNFGKESALLAGLEHASGSACVIMDCDLQHPPETLIEMFEIWQKGGVDIVEGIKKSRGSECIIYKKFANFFYYLIEHLGNISLKDSSDFQLLDRRVVDIVINLPERQRFFRAMSAWVGFTRKQVAFKVEPRQGGVSKFNFYKSTKYALTNITSFSSAPMQFVTFMGVAFFIAAIILSVQTLYRWFLLRAVEGFTTVILLLLIIGSMLMLSMGIIGLYIGKIYEEIKFRPQYLIEDQINANKGV